MATKIATILAIVFVTVLVLQVSGVLSSGSPEDDCSPVYWNDC